MRVADHSLDSFASEFWGVTKQNFLKCISYIRGHWPVLLDNIKILDVSISSKA